MAFSLLTFACLHDYFGDNSSELNIERYLVGDIPRVYYIPEWISEDEEKSILERVYAIPDEDDNVWVRLKHRRLQMWGGEVKAPFRPSPLPKWLLQIIQSLVDAKVFSEEHRPNHALINGESFVLNWHSVLISSFSADGWVFTLRAEYGVGEGIMPHEDGPSYFPFVAIISTGADSDVTFEPHRKLQQRDAFDGMATSSEANRAASPQPVLAGKFRFPLERRSLLLFTEEAYTKYLHSIDGVQSGKRVSLTIRHVRL